MVNDSELLLRYSSDGSQDAFTELVARHLPLVYNAALRQVAGEAQLAREAAQDVFIDMGRNAESRILYGSVQRRPHGDNSLRSRLCCIIQGESDAVRPHGKTPWGCDSRSDTLEVGDESGLSQRNLRTDPCSGR